VSLGQGRAVDIKISDRVGLISKIKGNKDNANINYSIIRSLAINYHIPNSVAGVFPFF
jgi:hypothetical protein